MKSAHTLLHTHTKIWWDNSKRWFKRRRSLIYLTSSTTSSQFKNHSHLTRLWATSCQMDNLYNPNNQAWGSSVPKSPRTMWYQALPRDSLKSKVSCLSKLKLSHPNSSINQLSPKCKDGICLSKLHNHTLTTSLLSLLHSSNLWTIKLISNSEWSFNTSNNSKYRKFPTLLFSNVYTNSLLSDRLASSHKLTRSLVKNLLIWWAPNLHSTNRSTLRCTNSFERDNWVRELMWRLCPDY